MTFVPTVSRNLVVDPEHPTTVPPARQSGPVYGHGGARREPRVQLGRVPVVTRTGSRYLRAVVPGGHDAVGLPVPLTGYNMINF